MPAGMITVDAKNTFAYAVFLAATRKTIFGTETPDVAKDGQPKWAVDVAVTYLADPGRKAVSDTLSISMTGGDPANGLITGTVVEFDRLRCSVMAPEKTEQGNVRGGRLYFMADAMRRSTLPQNGSRPAAPVPAGKSE